MKNKFKLFGTQSLLFCAITLTALFAFALTACDNNSTTSNPSTSDPVQVSPGGNALTGQVDIPWVIVVGNTVEADITQLDGDGTISYQWMKSDNQNTFTNITSATGKNFVVTNDLSGKYLQVVVRREGNTGTITSNSVKVRANAPVVSGVTINGGDVEVSKGMNHSFNATVNGTYLEPEDQRVTWSVTGSTRLNTYISGNGLNIGMDETADELTVIAASALDSTKFGEITVTVTEFSGNFITINDLGSMKGSASVYILSSLNSGNDVASGYASIVDGSLIVGLKYFSFESYNNEPWKDTGEYYIKIELTYESYAYTNGAAINITNIDSNPKYNFQNQNTAIDFSKFAVIPLGNGGHKITINGLGSYNDAMASVELSGGGDFGVYPVVANGHAVISNGSVTITLSDANDYTHITGWKDGGQCFIKLSIDGAQGEGNPIPLFVYTNGGKLTTLGITTWSDFYGKAPKVNFTGGATSVNFDKFVSGDGIGYDLTGW